MDTHSTITTMDRGQADVLEGETAAATSDHKAFKSCWTIELNKPAVDPFNHVEPTQGGEYRQESFLGCRTKLHIPLGSQYVYDASLSLTTR